MQSLSRLILSALLALSAAPLDPETTLELLNRVKAGDDEARERLVARCMPPLRRWAPPGSRWPG